jgi:hypothetical protein
MPWVPETSELGPYGELQTFSNSIQYYTEEAGDVDPATGQSGASTITYYNVRIFPQETKPETITITSGNPATISGYFKRVFNDIISYRNFTNEIKTITTDENNGAWDKLELVKSDVKEISSFQPDSNRNIIKSYIAEAYSAASPNTVVSSTTYTINIRDRNWTPGQLALKELVSYTTLMNRIRYNQETSNITDPSLNTWYSNNGTQITWYNNAAQKVEWKNNQ